MSSSLAGTLISARGFLKNRGIVFPSSIEVLTVSESVLLVRKDGPVATVTLNRPDAMNALSAALWSATANASRELQDDPAIRVVIITGAGRAFCAGMDLKELGTGGEEASRFEQSAGMPAMAHAIAAFEGPVIAAVNGHAATAGFELGRSATSSSRPRRRSSSTATLASGFLPGRGSVSGYRGSSASAVRRNSASRAMLWPPSRRTNGAWVTGSWSLRNCCQPASLSRGR